MIRLNLLPSAQRKAVERVKTMTLVQELLVILFAFILLFSGVALYARLTLEQKFAQTILESTPGSKKIITLNREIDALNARLKVLQRSFVGVELWSSLLYVLGQYVPPSVTLQAVQVLPEGALTITGRAQTRTELLALQEQLNSQPLFKSVEVPLKYLVSERDLDFTMQATLNLAALKILP